MKLKLHELTKSLSFNLSKEDSWVKDVFTQLRLDTKGLVFIRLALEKNKNDIFVEGHLKLVLILNCSRCAEDIEHPVDEFFNSVFTQGKDTRSGNVELISSELEISYFQGDEIDLSEIIYEQILLVVPFQPLCKENCKGICAQCGQNLNEKKCQCKEVVTTSPFGVLKGVKVKKNKSS